MRVDLCRDLLRSLRRPLHPAGTLGGAGPFATLGRPSLASCLQLRGRSVRETSLRSSVSPLATSEAQNPCLGRVLGFDEVSRGRARRSSRAVATRRAVGVSAAVMALTPLCVVVAFSPNVATPAQRTDATCLDREATKDSKDDSCLAVQTLQCTHTPGNSPPGLGKGHAVGKVSGRVTERVQGSGRPAHRARYHPGCRPRPQTVGCRRVEPGIPHLWQARSWHRCCWFRIPLGEPSSWGVVSAHCCRRSGCGWASHSAS